MNKNQLLRVMKRVAHATPHEWITRISQKLHATQASCFARLGNGLYAFDEHRRSLGLSSIEEFPEWWKQHPTAPWVREIGPADNPCLSATIHDLTIRTQQIQGDCLSLFSRSPIDFSHPNRWHRDPILGQESPQAFFGSINYLDVASVGDSKYVWEPNRWGWVFPLGASYQATQDNSCFHTFRDWANDWWIHNPYPQGINYCSALEQSFRAYAVRWALELFRKPLTESQDAALLDSLCRLIWLACRHVERNLSWYFAPNTHLIGEAFLLYMVGTSLPTFRESARWKELGRRILLSEFNRQFHQDGTHKELSTCYHLYATDFYLHGLWISHQAGTNEPEIEQAAFQLTSRLRDLTPTSGLLPALNDCDGGRLTWFADKTLDARPTLLLAQQRWPNGFRCPCEWTCQGDHQWMTFESTETPSAAQRLTSISTLPEKQWDSGLVTYQNDCGDYVLFRAGPFGYHDCPHSHDNQLETLVILAGQSIVVDSGTGAYTQGITLRNQYRTACGKNTPLVSNRGPSEEGGAFSWRRRTEACLTDVRSSHERWIACGRHTGFTQRYGFPIHISRQVHAFAAGMVAIIDGWEADRDIDVTIPWTLSPELRWTEDGWYTPNGKVFHLLMDTYSTDIRDRKLPECHVARGPYSRDYGWNESTHAVSFSPPRSRSGFCLSLFTRSDQPIRSDGHFRYCIPSVNRSYLLEWDPTKADPIQIHPMGAIANW